MIRLLRSNAAFVIPFLLFIAAGSAWMLLENKTGIHLSINSIHHPLADSIMPYLTWAGDGWFITGICILSFAFSFRAGFILSLSNIMASLVTRGLKLFVFDDVLRPFEYFSGGKGLHLVEGVDMHSYYSFPSGHATIAFATAFSLCVLSGKHWLKFLLFVLALSAAYTRVYLSQHFLHDIHAGSVIGFCSALFAALIAARWNPDWFKRSLIK